MEHLLTLLADNFTYIGILLVVCVGILFLFCSDWNAIRRKARHAIPINTKDFLDEWEYYRQHDQAGCYVILIYKRRPFIKTVKKNKRYQAVYIGQSINIHKRVYNHLTGHGNGDVYADVKYGKHVFVKFIPCDSEQLNKYEKELIRLFKATDSYNRTKGGAKITAH
ncbi:MAG: GIY-YIG nuclease family protein [Bacteroidaceae bacterium]|nr:GIY-YIG nuclease family protein [Bacteroidaceae bacterium]